MSKNIYFNGGFIMEKVINFDAIKANRAEMKEKRAEKKAERKAKKEAEKKAEKKVSISAEEEVAT